MNRTAAIRHLRLGRSVSSPLLNPDTPFPFTVTVTKRGRYLTSSISHDPRKTLYITPRQVLRFIRTNFPR